MQLITTNVFENILRTALIGLSLLLFGASASIDAQTLDAFNPNASLPVNDIEVLPDGKILIAGQFTTIGGVSRNGFARLNADGTLDTTFPNVVFNSSVLDIIIQPDGKILVSGSFDTVNGVTRNRVARLNADGMLDTGFNAGFTPPVGVARIALQPDGKIIVPGSFGSSPTVLRRNSDGSADASFGARAFDGTVAQVILQPDGKVLAVGVFTTVDEIPRRNIARLNANGSLDNSFNMASNGSVFLATLAADGKVYAGGNFTTVGGQPRTYFARLNSDGSLDASFQTPTLFHPAVNGGSVRPSIILPNGKILIGGVFDTIGGVAQRNLARLNADGTHDTTFRNMQVGVDAFTSPLMIKRQADGRILVGGSFTTMDGQTRNRIARITTADSAAARTPFDFDGDGRADLAVYRPMPDPANNQWYVLRSSDSTLSVYEWGLQNDQLVGADYDGDGRTDHAIYRREVGQWHIAQSSNQQFRSLVFGIAEDIPIPGDFDGDDKADIGVFRPSNGSWYYIQSTNGQSRGVQFGHAGDIPMNGDFDNDGKTDIAVFRPSSGFWYWIRSSDGQTQFAAFGLPGDIPVNGDFNGDGRNDLAVFRPSDGYWYVARPTGVPAQNFEATQFGLATDTPVPADYDGDGRTDIAVFRGGTWFINRQSGGFAASNFGLASDKPIPARTN